MSDRIAVMRAGPDRGHSRSRPSHSATSPRAGIGNRRVKRETTILLAWLAMLLLLAFTAPVVLPVGNLRDVLLANISVLIAAIGMTLVILIRQIDVSIGAQFAVCGIAAGLLAKTGLPMLLVALTVIAVGAALGSLNAALVASLRLPSIVVTLAAMAVLRDSIRWGTGGAWVQGLPPHFQWFGLGQGGGEWLTVIIAAAALGIAAWASSGLLEVAADLAPADPTW